MSSKLSFCFKCNQQITFQKIRGYWQRFNKSNKQKHDCAQYHMEQKANIQLKNYNNKKYGKNHPIHNSTNWT